MQLARAAASIAAALTVTAAGNGSSTQRAAPPAKIIYVNVGQGDAVVMRIGGKIIVSDTGEFRYDVLDEALRDGLKAKRIDVLILGHARDDHAKNAAELLRDWEVRRVVMSQSLWWDGTQRNRAVMAAIRQEPNLERDFPDAGDRFDWGRGRVDLRQPASRRVPRCFIEDRRQRLARISTERQQRHGVVHRRHREESREADRGDPRPGGERAR